MCLGSALPVRQVFWIIANLAQVQLTGFITVIVMWSDAVCDFIPYLRNVVTKMLKKISRIVYYIVFFLFFTDNETTIRLRRRRRRWWGQIAEGIIRSYTLLAFIFWKSIMPVGGRVAGKGVGVHNSGGSSDGNDIITIV